MSDTNDVWLCSRDEEVWSSAAEYVTREEAIKHGAGELGVRPNGSYWVGKKASVLDVMDRTLFSADRFLEDLGMLAVEQVGDELADSWPESPGKAAEEELERDVAKVLRAWVEKHGLTPSFYAVREVTSHFEPEYSVDCQQKGCDAPTTLVFESVGPCADEVEPRLFSCTDCAGQGEADLGVKPVPLEAWLSKERLASWERAKLERAKGVRRTG